MVKIDKKEIAMYLTISMIENAHIKFDDFREDESDKIEQANSFNTKQVIDAYNTIFNGIFK